MVSCPIRRSSCLALRRTARPLGCLGPRQSRRGVCRSLDGSGPTLSGCGQSSAAHTADAGLTFFRAPAAIPARYITGERSGTRPGAWKRRTGKTQIFSLGSGQGNFNFDQTEFNADLAAVAALCAKADAALVQGATGGQHSRRLAKRCPHRQPTTRIHSPAAGPTRRARATPAVTEENIVNEHILRRCYCADTFDSLRCDARSTRRAAGTRAPPQNTRRAHRMRILDARRRLLSRNGAGVVGVASKHSVVAPARQRPDSEPGTIPPVRFFRCMYDGEAGLLRDRASNGATKGGRDRSRAPPVRRRTDALGTAVRRPCGAL